MLSRPTPNRAAIRATPVTRGCVRTVLVGGVHDGQAGEVTAPGGNPPERLRFFGGSVVYALDHQASTRAAARYRYLPAESSAHAGFVEADRQAVLEVARDRGITPEALLEEARTRAADTSRRHPADVLVEEAARLGVDVETLLRDRGLATFSYPQEG